MGTKIACFIIAIVFLLTFLGGIFLTVWSTTEEERQRAQLQKDFEELDYGKLPNFIPLEEPLEEGEVIDLELGDEDGLSVRRTDVVTIDYDIAFAKDGEIIVTTNSELDEEVETLTTAVQQLNEYWQNIVVGMKVSSYRRALIPAEEFDEDVSTIDTPIGLDMVWDIKLIGIADRPEGLPDFSLLDERLTEIRVEDIGQAEESANQVEADDFIEVDYLSVFADTNYPIADRNQAVWDLSSSQLLAEHLTGLQVGDKRRIFLPEDQATQFLSGQSIIAGYDVVVDVEIIDIVELEVAIEDLTVGSGQAAVLGDQITVNYRGLLASDQSEFEARDGQTFSLTQGSLIQGWLRGIPGMKIGGKRRLEIPAGLAYGATGNASIPPNSDLIFEIELVDIISQEDGQ